MSRYHFHIEDGVAECDDAGVEMPFSEVVPEAIARLAKILRDRPAKLTDTEELLVKVQDDTGMTLLTVHTILTYAPAASLKRA